MLAGASILVADDEPNIRNTISDILRKYGAKITTAANGAEAIVFVEKQDFNLVLSDINMPDKNGYDVFAAARRKSTSIPVMLMTGFGYDPNHSIVRASQEGLQAVLFKPFKVDQLLAEVRKAPAASSRKVIMSKNPFGQWPSPSITESRYAVSEVVRRHFTSDHRRLSHSLAYDFARFIADRG